MSTKQHTFRCPKCNTIFIIDKQYKIMLKTYSMMKDKEVINMCPHCNHFEYKD